MLSHTGPHNAWARVEELVGSASCRRLLPSPGRLSLPPPFRQRRPAGPGASKGSSDLKSGASPAAASVLPREHGLLSYFLHGLRYSEAAVQTRASCKRSPLGWLCKYSIQSCLVNEWLFREAARRPTPAGAASRAGGVCFAGGASSTERSVLSTSAPAAARGTRATIMISARASGSACLAGPQRRAAGRMLPDGRLPGIRGLEDQNSRSKRQVSRGRRDRLLPSRKRGSDRSLA